MGKELQQKLHECLLEFAAENDLEIIKNSLKYSDAIFDFSISFKSLDEDLVREDFAKSAGAYGIPESAYGRIIDFDDKKLRVVGFDRSKRKYKIVCEDVENGNRIGITVESLRARL